MEIIIQDRDKALGREKDKIDYIHGKLESLDRFQHVAKIECQIATHRKTDNFMHYAIHVQAWCAHGKHHYHAKQEGSDFFDMSEKITMALENQIQKNHR